MFLRNPHLNGDSFFLQGTHDIGVLLIHGFTATTVEVSYAAKYLNERGYTVSAPLLPGHNTTPDDLNKCKWQDWANAAEAAYQELATHCKKIIVGGESMGGMLALYLASEHPEIIAVVTYAPAMITPSSSSRWQIQILSWLKPYMPKPQRPPNITDERTKSYTVNPLKAVTQFLDLQQRNTSAAAAYLAADPQHSGSVGRGDRSTQRRRDLSRSEIANQRNALARKLDACFNSGSRMGARGGVDA